METENNSTSLRVASFSCYVESADNKFMHKIKRAMEDPIPNQEITSYSIISSAPRANMVKSGSINNHISESPRVPSFSHYLDPSEESFAFKGQASGAINLEKTKSKDGEIDIFGADRYFNMRLSGEIQPKQEFYQPHQKSNFGAGAGTGTPSVYSEASSWNSQAVLLRNLQRNGSQLKQKKALGRRFFTSLMCKGPCLNKKDVYVNTIVDEETVYASKPSQQGSRINEHENPIVKTVLVDEKVEDPRQSLEVFGFKPTKKGDIISKNLERKVSTLTWDAIPKSQKPSIIQNSSTICDDMASDASSDLFELEHISVREYGLLSTQDQTDNISSCMSPTTHYAPSEVSIDWSVVTASAAEFASVISDYEDRSVSVAGDFISRDHNKTTKNTKNVGVGNKGTQKSRPSGILGCKNNKAVNVVETRVHKTNDQKVKHQVLPMDSSVSLGKLQASAKVKDIESMLIHM